MRVWSAIVNPRRIFMGAFQRGEGEYVIDTKGMRIELVEFNFVKQQVAKRLLDSASSQVRSPFRDASARKESIAQCVP